MSAGTTSAGFEGKFSIDNYGCGRGEIKLAISDGPLGTDALLYDSDNGWFPGKAGKKGGPKFETPEELASSAFRSTGKVGESAQVKLAAGACVGSKNWGTSPPGPLSAERRGGDEGRFYPQRSAREITRSGNGGAAKDSPPRARTTCW